MPIVVNELVFKGEIAAPGTRDDRTRDERPPDRRETKALVEICVEEVLRVLRRAEER